MLSNLASFVIGQLLQSMNLLDDVALLQIAFLQQDCLKEMWRTPRRNRTRRPKIYQTRPWLVEGRRRLYGHYARLM